ncbi:hypothetical protein D3C77_379500 [compost metagenome]
MGAGLRVYKEDGSLVLNTDYIAYGLLKSGYMTYQAEWPRLGFRSANLNPNDPSSYSETSIRDHIYGFTVVDAIAPIVFISGLGSACGVNVVGNQTTFYYIGADSTTKFYYFDTMRQGGSGAGLKCYNPAGQLTFNSLQYPLDVDYVLQPPPPYNYIPTHQTWGMPYTGGVKSVRTAGAFGPVNVFVKVTTPLPAGSYAASLTFSRGIGMGYIDSGPVLYMNSSSMQEGAGGVANGVQFIFCIAARPAEVSAGFGGGTRANTFYNIPTDRYPTALVIRTDSLPFPYN